MNCGDEQDSGAQNKSRALTPEAVSKVFKEVIAQNKLIGKELRLQPVSKALEQTNNGTGTHLNMMTCTLNIARPPWEIVEISKDPSYHGALTGKEAEARLERADGDSYLIRYSKRRDTCVISLSKQKDGYKKFMHFDLKVTKIKRKLLPGSVVKFEINKTEQRFDSIRKLLKFYEKNAVSYEVISGIGKHHQRPPVIPLDRLATVSYLLSITLTLPCIYNTVRCF